MTNLRMFASPVSVVNVYSTGNLLAISNYWQLMKDRQFLPIHEKHTWLSQLVREPSRGGGRRRSIIGIRQAVMNHSSIPHPIGRNKTVKRRVVAASQTALLVAAMCVGTGWVQPQQAHACSCGPSTNGSGGTNGVNSSVNDPKKPPVSPPGDTPSGGTPSGSPTGGTSTGGTSTGGGIPDDTVDYGGYAGGSGSGGGVPGLHVTSAPRLPASAGAWSSGGWSLGGMLGGPELPSWGPLLEAPPCPGSNPPCMAYSAQQTIGGTGKGTGDGTTPPDDDPDDNPDDNGSTAVGTSGTSGTSGGGGGGGTAVAIATPVVPDVTVPAAGPVELPRPPVEPINDLAPLNRHVAVVLMSNVGTGFSAVIIILILLTIGIWYFGHRVAVQLATVEKRNA